MKRLSAMLTGMLVWFAAPLLMAQAPDGNHIFAHLPIRIGTGPQDPSGASGILPAQLKAAYGFNQIPNQGQGQTIAIVDAFDDPNIASDLAFYQTYFNLTPCNFQKVKVGNPATSIQWGLEMSLDVEQACALAPKSNIILVEANSDSFTDLFAAIQVASSAPYNATVISMSWGHLEFANEQSYDSYFCNIVAGSGQAVTFVAASGDIGNHPLYPAASPCVIAAGGTTLALRTAAELPNPLQLNYGAEVAWGNTGGGVSPYESQMSWQNPACAEWSTTNRCIPDVASDASQTPGVPVYATFHYDGWMVTGGTSLASPDWAAFFTLVNSLRASQGKGTLSQAGQDLYTIYYSSNYLTDFHDIIHGSNGLCGSECNAGPGYDLVTGIGSYQTNVMAPALLAAPN